MKPALSYAGGRGAALLLALRRMFERPLNLLLALCASALAFTLLLLTGLGLWRAQPLEAPNWVQPQALVLVAGAEGEVDLGAVRAALAKLAHVQSVDFFGRDAALAELAQRKGLAAVGLAELRPNPLPDAFTVRLAAGDTPESLESTVADLRKVKYVDSVEYQPDAYRRFFALLQLGRRALLLACAVLVAAVVAGAALAVRCWLRVDRKELAVLQLLGAEPVAIRRPYVYAGALTLAAAGALSGWSLGAIQAWLDPPMAEAARLFSLHWAANPAPPATIPVLALAGAVLGALLTSLALRIAARSGPA